VSNRFRRNAADSVGLLGLQESPVVVSPWLIAADWIFARTRLMLLLEMGNE